MRDKKCPRCKKVYINENQEMCGLCTNADRKQKIRQGLLVVLTIDMSKVRQTTLMRIKALIQADMER